MIGRRSHDDAQSFEEAWSGRTPRDEHIAELVRFAEGLCEAAVVEPSMQFRDSLRTQLMAEATTVLVPLPKTTRTPARPVIESHPARRRVAGLTAAVVASVGVVGMVASSASAVPGEMLYPVKRSVESVELKLHRDDASRGAFQLAQASERLAEARQLSDGGGSETLVAETLDDFATQAAAGSSKLFSDFSDNGKEQSVRKVNDFAAAASVNLSELSSLVPSGADDSFKAATAAVSELATEASSLCKSCTTADVQALVSAVTDLSRDTPAKPAPAKDKGKDKGSKSGSGSSTGSSATPAAQGPSKSPVTSVPTTPVIPTPNVPSVSDLTDPLLGGLLGDDNQEGLVPGLLNGLLGGGKK